MLLITPQKGFFVVGCRGKLLGYPVLVGKRSGSPKMMYFPILNEELFRSPESVVG